jgi:hypothetical protein
VGSRGFTPLHKLISWLGMLFAARSEHSLPQSLGESLCYGVKVPSGPYLRNKHPWGWIGWGPQGTGPLPTVGDLVPRGKPSKPRQCRCGRPVERGSTLLTTPRKIEGKEVPEALSKRNMEGAIAISTTRTESKRHLAPHFLTESLYWVACG